MGHTHQGTAAASAATGGSAGCSATGFHALCAPVNSLTPLVRSALSLMLALLSAKQPIPLVRSANSLMPALRLAKQFTLPVRSANHSHPLCDHRILLYLLAFSETAHTSGAMSNFTHTTSGAISMTARTSGAMSNFTYTSGAISAF